MTEPLSFRKLILFRTIHFHRALMLRNLPHIAALALAIFGVAYSNFSGRPINGYWEFLAIAMGFGASPRAGRALPNVRRA